MNGINGRERVSQGENGFKESIFKRFGHLNEKRTPYDRTSVQYIPCCPMELPKRYESAPTVLIHDKIEEKPRHIEAFEPGACIPNPNIYLDSILCCCTIKNLNLAAGEDEVRTIFEELLKTEFPENRNADVIINLLTSVFIYCKAEQFSDKRMETLIKLFYHTHKYFISSLWRSADDVYSYFKELVMLHGIQNPPQSALIFSPIQAQKALLLFCKLYMRHLPLIKAVCLPTYKLKFEWLHESSSTTNKGNHQPPIKK